MTLSLLSPSPSALCFLSSTSSSSTANFKRLWSSRSRTGPALPVLTRASKENDDDKPAFNPFGFVTNNPSSRSAIQMPESPAEDGNVGQMLYEVDREVWPSIQQEVAEISCDIRDNYLQPHVFQKRCMGSCYADEHYLSMFVSMKLGRRNSGRRLTWVDWSKGGPHPARFHRSDVTVEFLEKLRSESRCEYNGGKTSVCYLFARKFAAHALSRLLIFAPKLKLMQSFSV